MHLIQRRVTQIHLFRKAVIWSLVFILVYVGSSQLGRYFFNYIGSAPALLWPPPGIALAALVLAGISWWPLLAVALLINQIINVVYNDVSIVITTLSAVGNLLQAVVGIYLLNYFRFDARMARLKDALLIVFSAIFVTMIAPTLTLGVSWLAGMQTIEDAGDTWVLWWLGSILSVILFTPIITAWHAFKISDFFALFKYSERRNTLELLLAYGLLIVPSYYLFFTPINTFIGISFIYPELIAFVWISLRFGMREVGVALLLTAALGIIGIFFGTPPLTALEKPIGVRIMGVEQYTIILGVMFYIIAAVSEERKRAVEALQSHVLMLENALDEISSADKAKTEFIAILAHELRNPLAPVVNYLELLKQPDLRSDEIMQAVSAIEQNIKVVGKLLDDILDVSRVSKRKFKVDRERFVLQEAIRHSIESVETRRREKRIQFNVRISTEVIQVNADRFRLEQVFINLLDNAIKYSQPLGIVDIRGEGTPEGGFRLSVRDVGIGISQEMAGQIFEPFVQVSPSHAYSTGLGIGLFLSRNFVELHGGTLEVKSVGIGMGSEFIATFPPDMIIPVAGEKRIVQRTNASAVASQRNGSESHRILVVDDKFDAAVSFGRLLELAGHTTRVAHDGEEAIRSVKTFYPDIIFLDIRMPGMDGYMVAEKLRRDGVQAKIIALTGYGQEGDKRRAQESGFDGHLTKPVSFSRVLELLNSIHRVPA